MDEQAQDPIEEFFEDVIRGEAEEVQAAIDAGADVNKARPGHGKTPLMYAALGGNIAVLDLLMWAGANPNQKIRTNLDKGKTAVWMALECRDGESAAEVVTCLAKSGADLNSADAEGRTPIIGAIESDHPNVQAIRALIDAGADMDAVDARGRTALMAAEDGINLTYAGRCRSAISQMLRDAGATEDGLEVVALGKAIERGDLESVSRILESGADVNDVRSEVPPLTLAAACGTLDIVLRLVEAGADVNLRTDEESFTPLLSAAFDGHAPVVEALLEAGADPSASVSDFGTALELALGEGHEGVVEALR